MADELDKARTVEGTHAPTVEVDPTNELLDGDDTPLPKDLEDAGVVIDESGTRLVHADPNLEPGPDSNLELRKLADKHYQVLTETPEQHAAVVAGLREEYAAVEAAQGATDKDRLTLIKEQLRHYGADLKPKGDEVTDEPADPERAGQAEDAAKERAAAAKATGQDVPASDAPKGRASRKRTTTDGK